MLKNCADCGRIFAHPARNLCDECYKKVQETFHKVKEFLQKNPGATVVEVANATEVDVETIYEFIREGRLKVVPRDVSLSCEVCGDPITTGRFCARCRSSLVKGLQGEELPRPTPKLDTDSRVRYLDQLKQRRD